MYSGIHLNVFIRIYIYIDEKIKFVQTILKRILVIFPCYFQPQPHVTPGKWTSDIYTEMNETEMTKKSRTANVTDVCQ